MLVVGSVALSKYIPGIVPRDLDVFALKEEGAINQSSPNLEVTVPEPGSSTWDILQTEYGIASIYTLYWLKMSHRFKKNSPHFLKTMQDIHTIRRYEPSLWNRPVPPEWFSKREKETYNYSHPSLNKEKEDFFGDSGVPQIVDHDYLHELVAEEINGTCIPTYKRYADPTHSVRSSKRLWDNLDHESKLNGVKEEAMVLAIERSLLPFPGKCTVKYAYLFALQKVCTSITSGWFRDFAWENYWDASETSVNAAWNNIRKKISV